MSSKGSDHVSFHCCPFCLGLDGLAWRSRLPGSHTAATKDGRMDSASTTTTTTEKKVKTMASQFEKMVREDVDVARARFMVRAAWTLVVSAGRFIKEGKLADGDLKKIEEAAKRVMTTIENTAE